MGGVSLAGIREAFPRTFPVPLVFGFCEWSILYRRGSSRTQTGLSLAHMQLNLRRTHTKGSECKSHALAHMILCKQNKEISVLPDPLSQLRPCRALLLVSSPSSAASVYPYFHLRFHYTHRKSQVCKNIFNLDKTSNCCARCLLKCRSVLQG